MRATCLASSVIPELSGWLCLQQSPSFQTRASDAQVWIGFAGCAQITSDIGWKTYRCQCQETTRIASQPCANNLRNLRRGHDVSGVTLCYCATIKQEYTLFLMVSIVSG